MRDDRPAILGGEPVFPEKIDIVRPTLPRIAQVGGRFDEVLANGKITNHQRYVRAFEAALSARFGAPAALVANGTLAISLLLRALGRTGEVLVPSFTFAATAHAAVWCGLDVRFADVDPETWTLDPESAARACTPRTIAIMPVHVFGLPCDADRLSGAAREAGAPLVFDAAHGFGAAYRGRPVGSLGDAEIFSFHATKLFAVGEGGAVASRRDDWMAKVRAGRNFGLDAEGDCEEAGINAKMSELFAIIGLAALEGFDARLAGRRRAGLALRERVGKLPGITLQRIPEDRETNHQNFAVLVDPDAFGLTRDELHLAMDAENVMTRKYFHPPLHRMRCYAEAAAGTRLPETDRVGERVLCFPIYSDMTNAEVGAIARALERIHADRKAVRMQIVEGGVKGEKR